MEIVTLHEKAKAVLGTHTAVAYEELPIQVRALFRKHIPVDCYIILTTRRCWGILKHNNKTYAVWGVSNDPYYEYTGTWKAITMPAIRNYPEDMCIT